MTKRNVEPWTGCWSRESTFVEKLGEQEGRLELSSQCTGVGFLLMTTVPREYKRSILGETQ